MRIAKQQRANPDSLSHADPVINKAKKLGFDAVEIYVSPPRLESFDKTRVKKALERFLGGLMVV